VFESYLWSCYDQRFSEVSQHLPPQNMEIIGRHCHLSYLEIDVLSSEVVIGPTDTVVCLRVDVLQEPFNVAG